MIRMRLPPTTCPVLSITITPVTSCPAILSRLVFQMTRGEYSPFSTVSSSASIKAKGDGDVDRILDGIEISDVVLKFLPDDPQTNFSTRMVRTLQLRFPKPRNCLGLIDLQTATEVITLFTVINKVSGFYGILSLFTGNAHCP
jgi:hypothetical protein